MGSFLRASITDDTFIKGAARVVYAAEAQGFPTKISDILRLTATPTNEVQTLTGGIAITAGIFRLEFLNAVSADIAFNASAATVQAALEAMNTIGAGNVLVTGGPINTATAVSVTFQGSLAGQDVPALIIPYSTLTGGTVVIATTVSGQGLFDLQTGWTDLGATRGGVNITRNNTEETYEVDQIAGEIESTPTGWEMRVATQIAEVTPTMLKMAWEGGTITTSVAGGGEPLERHLPLGQPTKYVRRRLCVLHRRNNDKVRAHCFRKVQRGAQESALAYAKTGEQQSIPVNFRCLADSTVSDENARFGEIIDQV